MLTWLRDNLATIVVGLVLFAILASVVVHMVKARKQGKGSCGCGCSGGCAGACHNCPGSEQ